MKRMLKGYLLGLLSAILFVSGAVYAANPVRIVVDGKEIHPTDANGNSVSPIIQNGTTYLPVRAVADALGKAVYWDGPNYTVYIGEMDGRLEYPTVELEDMVSIFDRYSTSKGSLTDNYGNRYNHMIDSGKNWDRNINNNGYILEYLLNMKYSAFKGTLYVPEGLTSNGVGYIVIEADGKTIYTSPELDKTSNPIDINVNLTGCNDVSINFWIEEGMVVCLGNAGFYQ